MTAPFTHTILMRRGTSVQWSTTNPVLGVGEEGLDTTLNRVKTGNGVTPWNSLPFPTAVTASTSAPTSPQIGDIWVPT